MSRAIQLRLQSTGLVYTPGYVKWLRCMYHTEPEQARRFMAEVYGLKPALGEGILRQEFQEEVVGEDLVVTVQGVA